MKIRIYFASLALREKKDNELFSFVDVCSPTTLSCI